MSDFNVTTLFPSLTLRNTWKMNHFDFQNVFSNEKLKQELYVALCKYIFTE